MCLGIPAQIIEFKSGDPLLKPAKANFGGIDKEIYLGFTPEATIGDYVLVHVGFAISIIDQKRADELLEALKREGAVDEISK